MLKKLSEEKLHEILEAGIDEFAGQGPDRASVGAIARRAGVSVGVLYKYFDNKDALFLACLRHALCALEAAVDDALSGELSVVERSDRLIRSLQRSAREKPGYHILYHEITAGACRRYAKVFAREIEGITARVYEAMLFDAQRAGHVRADMNPRLFAFFFDNLLMMLQFSYTCEYYRERFRIYCGEETLANDELVAAELIKFLAAGFGAAEQPACEQAGTEKED